MTFVSKEPLKDLRLRHAFIYVVTLVTSIPSCDALPFFISKAVIEVFNEQINLRSDLAAQIAIRSTIAGLNRPYRCLYPHWHVRIHKWSFNCSHSFSSICDAELFRFL